MTLVIMCAAGLNNVGDEAILDAFLQKYIEKYHLILICFNKKNVSEYQKNIECIEIGNKKCKEAIRKCDVFVLGGGGLFQDETSVYNIFRWGYYLNYAKKHGKKTMLYSNSIGPINYLFSKVYLKRVLSNVSVISLRDSQSEELLKKLNIKGNIVVSTDSVFTYKNKEISENTEDEKYICLVIRHWYDQNALLPVFISNKLKWISKKNRKKYEKMLFELSHLVDVINEKYCLKVIFLPFIYERDKGIIEEIMKKVKNKKMNEVVYENAINIYNYEKIIKHSECLIGMRLHSLIFAIRNLVPFISLSYSDKVTNFIKDIELDYLNFQIDNIKCEQLEKCLNNILNTRQKWVNKLSHIRTELEFKAHKNDISLCDLIEN